MKSMFTLNRLQKLAFTLLLALAAASGMARAQQVFPLGSVDLNMVEQDTGSPRANRSTARKTISIGGETFSSGLGTHAHSQVLFNLDGKGVAFSAKVGVDDEVGTGNGSVIFKVLGDKKVLWQSPAMHAGDAALQVSVDLKGVKQLALIADESKDVIGKGDADWAEAKITMTEGKPVAVLAPREPVVILTPKSSPSPRINGARVFGVRPGAPFLFTISASGDRPMTFAANGLPDGLQLDPDTGRITGMLNAAGEYKVTFHAKNSRGDVRRDFKIVCGPQIGLTPAMGWNSWNCFASAVTDADVRSAADAMVKSGLINHGWTYINIDDYWEVNPSKGADDPTLQGLQRDDKGRIIPNPRFPDMKALTDYVHSKGLKIGLYSSPGPLTCGRCIGSFDHEDEDAQQYGDWGFDYLKYDWCSYSQIVTNETRANYTVPTLRKPYEIMRAALDKVHRDILFSFCQYGMGNVWEWGAEVGGNSWRTTGDIRDTWSSMSGIGFNQNGHEKYAGPGHFNDPDMLVVGMVGWGPKLHPTRLSPNEQYTHISLWCLLDSPLLIGCDMTQLDHFTFSLLSNDEVLDVSQDPLGRQAARVSQDGSLEVWAKDMEDGSKAVGLFNRGKDKAEVKVRWSDLGLTGKQKVRDLWRQKDLGKFNDEFAATVPKHGVVLVRIWPAN
jgi:alpha-galactosidase